MNGETESKLKPTILSATSLCNKPHSTVVSPIWSREAFVFPTNTLAQIVFLSFFQALSEAHRVLRPGGRFMCLEFSHVTNPVLGSLYDLYSFQVIPPMGKVLAGDWDSYQYLVESIRKFPDQETFRDMIRNAGFKGVTYENLTFGVSAVHSGFKLK